MSSSPDGTTCSESTGEVWSYPQVLTPWLRALRCCLRLIRSTEVVDVVCRQPDRYHQGDRALLSIRGFEGIRLGGYMIPLHFQGREP
jgi:hypothetical protein